MTLNSLRNSQVSVQVAVRLRPPSQGTTVGRAVKHVDAQTIKVTTTQTSVGATSPVSSLLNLSDESSKKNVQSDLDLMFAASSKLTKSLLNEPKAHSFQYDMVFGADAEQAQVYEQTMDPLIQEFLRGFHCTVFAYGQTGSGKTYTMGSGPTPAHVADQGILPRALTCIFEQLKMRAVDFRASISLVEVYNEEVYDLLRSNCSLDVSSARGLSLREDTTGTVYVQGAQERHVRTSAECLEWLQTGLSSRSTGSTYMNAVSSRSHAILTLSLYQQRADGSGVLHSKFHFVDLAGSERLKRSKALGDRKKEGIAINQALLVLGQVISALAEKDQSNGCDVHVPYRDSKLTRLLQSSLGGNSRTLMLACISPNDADVQESLCTLRYAARARSIKNACCVNVMRPTSPASQEFANEKEQLERRASILDAENKRLKELLVAAMNSKYDLANDARQSWLNSSQHDFYLRHAKLHERFNTLKTLVANLQEPVALMPFVE